MRRLNAQIRRWSIPAMWGAGGCILLAMAVPAFRNGFYAAAFILAGAPVGFRAVQALRFKTVSIELLVSIAALGALIIGEYNESAIVTFLFQFGSFLEQKTMKKTRSAIKSLTELAPITAFRIREDGVEEIDADEVEVGDILLVKAGNQLASDGTVVKGEGYVTESSITGEPLAKHKLPGDTVYAGTILQSGTLQMQASKVGEDTTFAKIIALVEEAQDAKSPVERFIDRFAKYYTPGVIATSLLVLLVTRSVDTAITVLVLACPGALVIGAPIANVAGIGRGAQEGILLKGGDSVHTFAKTDTVVFDKTGTLTEGVPRVCAEKAYCENPKEALRLAAMGEQASHHPLARAITDYAGFANCPPPDSAETVRGQGIIASIGGRRVLVGSKRLLLGENVPIPDAMEQDFTRLQQEGVSTVLVAVDGQAALLLGISDKLKPDAEKSLARLKKLGIRQLVMLTGDNRETAESIARQLALSQFRAELLPEDKLAAVRQMQSAGSTVTFVGDGINDSPALAAADTGIAMGSGTDVAIDNSDVVLIKSDLQSLARALELSRRTVAVLYENIAIAVTTVVLLLAGLLAGYIHMSLGMLIHEASIFLVILNAMRLLIPSKKRKGL